MRREFLCAPVRRVTALPLLPAWFLSISRMPEGPELFLASRYINAKCGELLFSGKVEKSEVSKNPEVPFESDGYTISAVSRGKELKLTLVPVQRKTSSLPPPPPPRPVCPAQGQKGARESMDLVFRFGMSGGFRLVPVAELPKHAHLRFYTKERPPQALCYVDVRRFGRWEVNGTWQADRGPCVMLEYEKFREHVLRNLSDKAFDKPICEALLNQKFFNGIGNYLRAEILYRLKIPPFEKARTVLEDLQHRGQTSGMTLSRKVATKRANPDLLELCHMLPKEVVQLGGKGYDPESAQDSTAFEEWLQCYSVPGMKSLSDSNNRTIWFQGDPGPMAPKKGKSRKKRVQVKEDPDAPSPKVTEPAARRNSRISAPQDGAVRMRKAGGRKGSKVVQETEDAAVKTGARTPNTRARRKISVLPESPPKGSPAESRKKRTSAQKRRARAAATTRSRRAKAQ
ncbi:endonuclease 8-like 1 isoform X2 [Varanus komodoensis]|uniref:endonuclease 8-like 1 isoform X2 n=1 Tax=Varanus komodoensis TaxID=61221 RepID=UPI001CF7B0CB|nr:endonuclease 8-like 1 isoform X2 [Varanus komodoensis]